MSEYSETEFPKHKHAFISETAKTAQNNICDSN